MCTRTDRTWAPPPVYPVVRDFARYPVPAILVILVTMVGTLLTAMNIVREKEAGTLDQLNVTPIGRATFIAAKLIPFSSLALLDLALGLVIARFVFGAAAIYLLAAQGGRARGRAAGAMLAGIGTIVLGMAVRQYRKRAA